MTFTIKGIWRINPEYPPDPRYANQSIWLFLHNPVGGFDPIRTSYRVVSWTTGVVEGEVWVTIPDRSEPVLWHELIDLGYRYWARYDRFNQVSKEDNQ